MHLDRLKFKLPTKLPEDLAARRWNPPRWWSDANLGIFIHWGLYSVPAFAPRRELHDIYTDGSDNPMAESPYAEWYANSLRFPDSSVGRFHREHYGDADYNDFEKAFTNGLENWDPHVWARQFAATGAKYVVIVTKHHDGYCLWPTDAPNPNRPGFHSERDIAGELAEAVRAAGMRFGVYYSGGYDWTFDDHPIGGGIDSARAVPFGDYTAYAAAHVRELIDRYEPSVLWNDICWPGRRADVFELARYYFDRVPDGCMNDRFFPAPDLPKVYANKFVGKAVDKVVARVIGNSGILPPKPPFAQHRTPEYAKLPNGLKEPWEMTRGLDLSFAYNQMATDEDYLSKGDLLASLTHTMNTGGNFLINVGPKGKDATIPAEQLTRLEWMAEQNAETPWADIRDTRNP